MKKIVKLGTVVLLLCSSGCSSEKKPVPVSKVQIYNGLPDVKNKYLSTARLKIGKYGGCSGVLVSERHVLTASHCFPEMKPLESGDYEYPADQLEVTFEQVSQFGGTRTGPVEVEKVIVSKFRQWNECVKLPADPNDGDCDFLGYTQRMTGLDLAVVILKESTVSLPFDVQPLAFPSYGVFKGLTQPGEPAHMSGFGEVWKNDFVAQRVPSFRHFIQGVFLNPLPAMQHQAPKELRIEFRVGSALDGEKVPEDKKTIPCAGDSGGPVVSYYAGEDLPIEPFLLGIASRGHSIFGNRIFTCSDSVSAVYTSALAAQCWLSEKLPMDFSKPAGEGQGHFLCPTIKYEPNDFVLVPYKGSKK